MAVVVIVDDQGSAREMIRTLVQSLHESIEVKEFWDAEEALSWCSANGPDLVMLDYRMPSVDGITFTRRLRESEGGHYSAVMMITSQGDNSIRLAALQAGVVEFVTKPIVPQEIKLRVRNLLEMVGHRDPKVARMPALASAGERSLAVDALASLLARLRAQRRAYTHDTVSVVALVEAMATQMQLPADAAATARAAARVYDIGMALVPEETLALERSLTDQEQDAVHEHVRLSRELLSEVDGELAEIVYRHHEHYNGSGYPDHLVGAQIPLVSRLLSVADTFCSLVSKRPHREAFRISEALNHISGQSGTVFDPACVNALSLVVPELLGKTGSLPARDTEGVGANLR